MATPARPSGHERRRVPGVLTALMSALAADGSGAVLLDARGRWLAGNRPNSVLAREHGVALPTPSSAGHLPERVRRLMADRQHGQVRLTCPSCSDPLLIEVHAVSVHADTATEWLVHPSRRPASLVIVRHGRPAAVQSSVLARRLGLTPTEARIASALAAGLSVKRIADQRRSSIHTVRWHLSRMMRKLGVRRQPDLVRVLLVCRGLSEHPITVGSTDS